jgi:hypothetical protein
MSAHSRARVMGVGCWVVGAAVCALAAPQTPQATPDIGTLLARVGARIAEYYERAQNVICTEKTTVQPVGYDFASVGFSRITEYELRVETEAAADGAAETPEAKVVRQLLRVNGRPPRERDQKDRAGCTDANPLSAEPLVFLLPAHRAEYTFVSGGAGKGKDKNTMIIEYTSTKPEGRGELKEDPRGHEDCFSWSLPVVMKGRVWVDAVTYDVVRIEERMAGYADIAVPTKIARKHNLSDQIVVQRYDTTIRYKPIPFRDPDEAMLLPESIDTLLVVRGGLESIRKRQTFTDYRRFLTGARIVK